MLKLKSGVVSTLRTRFSKNFSKFSNAPDISQHPQILVFALGGPGSGKTTQCSRIVEHFGFTHLCAGDLLRAEIKSASSDGTIIHKLEKEGKIVPSEITVKLLQQAMQRSENNKFIIDGFPRNEENRRTFEKIMNMEPDLVLFFDCPEEELMKRLISRNQGRADDDIDIIPKRLQVYFESTLPVINYYSSQRKIQKINAGRSIDEVFEDVKGIFSNLKPQAELNSTNESS